MSEEKETKEQDDVVSNIKTNLTCQICEKLFLDPRILPCLHTFCCQCIETLLRNRPLKEKLLKCPTCQLETGLDSRKSVRKLPANSLLVSLLDLLHIQEGEAVECDVCDSSEESPAHARCKECLLYLCELHAEAHKRARDTKQHVLLSLEHLKTMSLRELNRPTYCTTHTDERLALFCDPCNVSICRDCALTDHRTHRTQFLEDAYSKLRPRLSQVLEQTRSVCVKVENALPVLGWMQARVNLKADGVLRDIEDSFNAKIKALEQRRSELRCAVELIRVNRKTSLEIQKRRLEASRDTLRVSCRFVKRVLEEGDPVYLLSAKDLMSERLESLVNQHYELQPREDHAIKFCADDDALQGLIDSFGSIDASYAHYATTTAEGLGLQEAHIDQPAYFTVVTRDRKGRPIICENSDVHVQIESPDGALSDAQVTAHNGGKHSVTYTPSVPGQHLIYVTIRSCLMNESPFAVNVPFKTRDYEGMNHPQLLIGGPGEEPGQLQGARGVAVDIKNRIVVCDKNNFRVQVFDSSGEFLFTFGKKGSGDGEFASGPFSVAVSKDGKLVVSDWSGGSVQVFDSKGKFLIRLTQPKDDAKCGKLCLVQVDHEDRVYVADRENRHIYVFNSSGDFLSHFKVGCLDEDDGLQSKLHGIMTNSRGEIVVSLANDGGFQVVSKDGKPLRNIPLPFTKHNKVFAPEAIAIDSNDNILVVDGMSNCLMVFSAQDGHLIAECARDSLCNPYGLAVDRLGRVIISDSSNQIKIF